MIEQISVFIENKSGKIADITACLAKAGVDLRALSVADTPDFGILRLLVNDAQKAKNVLGEMNCMVRSTGVVVVAVPDIPGGVALVLNILKENNVNIEYMYSLIGRGEEKAYMVFRVDNQDILINVLTENKLQLVTKEELGIK